VPPTEQTTSAVAEALAARQRAEEALAESQARTQAILDTAVDGIITIDDRGVVQTFNPAAERMFGYRAAEVLGRNVSVLMPSPFREDHDRYIAQYLETGQGKIIGIGREVVGQRKDGTTFPVELSVAEARHGDWRIFVGTVRDITERKQREENLTRALAELRATSQQLWQAAKLASVGELAASIAHELNNPLATVSLRIESALARTPPDDPRRRALEIIDQETRRMATLVANLLQFCRRGGEQISTVDVREELAGAVDLIHHHLRKRSIAVVKDLAADTPTIFADRQKLRQVFLNLLTNASDAMPRGGTLTLRASAVTSQGGLPAVRMEVADTGVGIPTEALPRVMEPFFTTKEEGKGTGLGLAICRRIVQEHHGKIEVVSEEGKGTTVRVLLPVQTGANVERLREEQK
jgi:PAS domain S-box-containing protein